MGSYGIALLQGCTGPFSSLGGRRCDVVTCAPIVTLLLLMLLLLLQGVGGSIDDSPCMDCTSAGCVGANPPCEK